MKVFVIPTWHPTPSRPLWCNWILPHIALLRESGAETYVLQLGLDGEPIPENTDPWQQPVRLLNRHHLYVPVPNPTSRYQRTCFFYGMFLRKYYERLREVYLLAVEKWGKPDVLHAHISLPGGYLTARLGREFGVPVIVQEHYSGFESDARFPWRTGMFVREMGHLIQGFYAVSPGFAHRINKTGLVRVSGVLPNPVDTDFFSPKCLGKTDSFRIVTTGKLGAIKGTDTFFKALSQLPRGLNWNATLFGEVEDQKYLSRLLRTFDFSPRVSLPGRVSQADLVLAYSQSDLFVVSSRSETANVSMLEAIACGLPVITTRCGGPETLIDNSVGITIETGNPQALAAGILQMANNSQRYNRNALRQFVLERYSKPTVAKQVMEAYQLATKSRLVI